MVVESNGGGNPGSRIGAPVDISKVNPSQVNNGMNNEITTAFDY